ncbi:alpha/beta-type small acid-soluble spore protein [Bacillus gobiensis]|uniref:small, acid-soluble spore protein, alpha/beta type n=1 Tax=Bacillus gobiensis TaxID=1441095 RepID=UPI003D210E7F
MARRNKLLVPEARAGVDQLKARIANTQDPQKAKYEAAKEVGVPLDQKYNGNLTSKEAGKIGGSLGGQMVREMIKMAEEKLKK